MGIPLAHVSCREGEECEIYQGSDMELKFHISAWCVLLSDSPLGLKPKRVIRRFNLKLLDDFKAIAVELALISDEILKLDNTSLFSIGPHDRTLPTHVNDLVKKSPVGREVYAFMKTGNPDVLRYLLSFLNFGKRVQVSKNDELEAIALRTWLEVERHISSIDFESPELDVLLQDIRTVLDFTLAPYYSHTPLPVHGNGSVAEKGVRNRSEKDSALRGYWPLTRPNSYWSRAVPLDRVIPQRANIPREVIHQPLVPPASRLAFVPKSVAALRSICMEPAILQWAQQSVRYALEDAISKSPWLRRFIDIHDQSSNVNAAQVGSEFMQLDTIDLSSASDSVSMRLVKKVFPRELLLDLLATRSRMVELPDGTMFHPDKFAPMGSAVCFPVQSVFYLAVVLTSYYRYVFGHGHRLSRGRLESLLRSTIDGEPELGVSGLRTIRVYGDDIICDSRITAAVMDNLTSLGFNVNQKKSFTGSSCFRESCGGFFHMGSDVTPFTLKISVIGRYMEPNQLSALIQGANRLLSLGYNHTRDYLIKVAHWWGSGPGTKGIRHLYYGRGHLEGDPPAQIAVYQSATLKIREFRKESRSKRGTHQQYQRDEGRFCVISPRTKMCDRDDVAAYISWMRSPGPAMTGSNEPVGHEIKFSWAWLPI